MNVKAARCDEIEVDGGVEIAVILDIVNVAIQIVVVPSRGDGGEVPIVFSFCHLFHLRSSSASLMVV